MMASYDSTLRVQTIASGKLRRYHHLKWWQHITIGSVFWPNVRDIFLVIVGFFQSLIRLVMWRPDVVFTKGGFVCLPVGYAAALLRIPVVIHDSDAHPGLTNRLLSRIATTIATGTPLEYYSYPAEKSHYVGIPISPDFRELTSQEKRAQKRSLGLDEQMPLVVVTGGGLGAKQLNDLVVKTHDALSKQTSIVLLSGREQYGALRESIPADSSTFVLKPFIASGMAELLGAADIVVSRAGATTLLELAALAAPTILVPSERLTWQIKHAQMYQDHQAVVLLSESGLESDPTLFTDTVERLLKRVGERQALARHIHEFAMPSAASDMAQLILDAAK